MSEKRKRITVSVKTKLNALETLHKKLEKGRHATRRGQDNHIKFGKVHRIYTISSHCITKLLSSSLGYHAAQT